MGRTRPHRSMPSPPRPWGLGTSPGGRGGDAGAAKTGRVDPKGRAPEAQQTKLEIREILRDFRAANAVWVESVARQEHLARTAAGGVWRHDPLPDSTSAPAAARLSPRYRGAPVRVTIKANSFLTRGAPQRGICRENGYFWPGSGQGTTGEATSFVVFVTRFVVAGSSFERRSPSAVHLCDVVGRRHELPTGRSCGARHSGLTAHSLTTSTVLRPSLSMSKISATSLAARRMQPMLAFLPIESGSMVPWMP